MASPTTSGLAANSGAVVAGVDGCRAGWYVVVQHLGTWRMEHHVASDFTEVPHVLLAWIRPR